MSAINSETFRAGTFDFYVGPNELHFILYKNLVSRYSAPLGRMMTNGMKESQEGKAFLKDVDPDTFCRFAEFIHSGDYNPAAPVKGPAPSTQRCTNSVLSAASKKKKRPGRVSSQDLLPKEGYGEDRTQAEHFVHDLSPWEFALREITQKTFATPPPAPVVMPPFPVDSTPALDQSPNVSYSQTLACHISTYHFADLYLVSELKDLAREKLSEGLQLFQSYPKCTADICHIIRLVYNHEDGDSHPSPLHEIVSDYATNNFRVLVAHPHFKDLLAEGGLFPPDLCRKIARLMD